MVVLVGVLDVVDLWICNGLWVWVFGSICIVVWVVMLGGEVGWGVGWMFLDGVWLLLIGILVLVILVEDIV